MTIARGKDVLEFITFGEDARAPLIAIGAVECREVATSRAGGTASITGRPAPTAFTEAHTAGVDPAGAVTAADAKLTAEVQTERALHVARKITES